MANTTARQIILNEAPVTPKQKIRAAREIIVPVHGVHSTIYVAITKREALSLLKQLSDPEGNYSFELDDDRTLYIDRAN